MTSDHVPICIEIINNQKSKVNIKKRSCKKEYNFNKANWDLFNSNLPKIVPQSITEDVEKLNHFIVQSLIEAASEAIPSYYRNKKHINSKSLPPHILQLIKARKLYRKEMLKEINIEGNKKMYNLLTKIKREEINLLKNNERQQFLR